MRGAPPSREATLTLLAPCPVAEWRRLYREVGAPWRWHDRDVWTDVQLAGRLAHHRVRVFRADIVHPQHGEMHGAGFLELELHDDNSVEVVYIGLVRAAFGLGLGRWIVSRAVDEAWAMGAQSVWLHTCTLDAPAALPNYLARGFVMERSEEYDIVWDGG